MWSKIVLQSSFYRLKSLVAVESIGKRNAKNYNSSQLAGNGLVMSWVHGTGREGQRKNTEYSIEKKNILRETQNTITSAVRLMKPPGLELRGTDDIFVTSLRMVMVVPMNRSTSGTRAVSWRSSSLWQIIGNRDYDQRCCISSILYFFIR